MTLTLRDQVHEYKSRITDKMLLALIEGLEEIAESDGDPYTMDSKEYYAHDRLSSIAQDALKHALGLN